MIITNNFFQMFRHKGPPQSVDISADRYSLYVVLRHFFEKLLRKLIFSTVQDLCRGCHILLFSGARPMQIARRICRKLACNLGMSWYLYMLWLCMGH